MFENGIWIRFCEIVKAWIMGVRGLLKIRAVGNCPFYPQVKVAHSPCEQVERGLSWDQVGTFWITPFISIHCQGLGIIKDLRLWYKYSFMSRYLGMNNFSEKILHGELYSLHYPDNLQTASYTWCNSFVRNNQLTEDINRKQKTGRFCR
jgi:hypothetical protein